MSEEPQTYVIRKTSPDGKIYAAGPDNVMGDPDWLEENERNPIYFFPSVDVAKKWAENNTTPYIDFIGISVIDENIRIENIYALEGIDYDKYPRIAKQEYVDIDTGCYKDIPVSFILEQVSEIKRKYRKSLHHVLQDKDICFDLSYYDEASATIYFVFSRYETNDEYRDRVNRQIAYEKKKANDRANSKKSKEEKERAQYERLRKKFEKEN